MCQKFPSPELNSTPTNTFPSRLRWMFTTWHSTFRLLFSFTSFSACPATTTCPSSNEAPCWLTERDDVCTQNFSPSSVCPCTASGTVSGTRCVLRRSLQRKCNRDIETTTLLFSKTAGNHPTPFSEKQCPAVTRAPSKTTPFGIPAFPERIQSSLLFLGETIAGRYQIPPSHWDSTVVLCIPVVNPVFCYIFRSAADFAFP